VSTVHVVVPEGVDDPERPSGGNVYDRMVCRRLADGGWTVHQRIARGAWPLPDRAATAGLAELLRSVPDGDPVLVDGLVASAAPEVLLAETARLRLVILLHMPLGPSSGEAVCSGERAMLASSAAVVTTSRWSRGWLVAECAVPVDHVHVAEPGVDLATASRASDGGRRLLCVASVTPNKGHDVLLEALERVRDLDWELEVVGSLSRDPSYVRSLRRQVRCAGIADRVDFVGPRSGLALDAAYAASDALVLASRFETYGMVVTEALARGLPVLATSVGGLPEALGRSIEGRRPGLLVQPGDPRAMSRALRRWLTDDALRDDLRRAARQRRLTLKGWDLTADVLSGVLSRVAA
jgi:glycosyltransferase involved in cell wall biosynthesis